MSSNINCNEIFPDHDKHYFSLVTKSHKPEQEDGGARQHQEDGGAKQHETMAVGYSEGEGGGAKRGEKMVGCY
jgi:hypothetical protein